MINLWERPTNMSNILRSAAAQRLLFVKGRQSATLVEQHYPMEWPSGHAIPYTQPLNVRRCEAVLRICARHFSLFLSYQGSLGTGICGCGCPGMHIRWFTTCATIWDNNLVLWSWAESAHSTISFNSIWYFSRHKSYMFINCLLGHWNHDSLQYINLKLRLPWWKWIFEK